MQIGNLFNDAIPPGRGERFDTLLAHRNLVVERILSSADISLEEQRQAHDEWVLLVCGEADLEVAGAAVALKAGDHLFLPAGTPHTVRRVAEGSLWLAVHLHPEAAPVQTPAATPAPAEVAGALHGAA